MAHSFTVVCMTVKYLILREEYKLQELLDKILYNTWT
jgi:hypothetical protein